MKSGLTLKNRRYMLAISGITLLILLLLFLLNTGKAGANPGKKRAVIVGINKYMNGNNLKGCVNDSILMATILKEVFDFKKEDIIILNDEKATRNNILKVLNKHLVEKSEPGDIAVFYFSGHGSQVKDQSGDEKDKKDEILCPHDTSFQNRCYILDDELNGIISRCRASHFFIGLDSCHSGTGTRTFGAYKYSDARFMPNPYLKDAKSPEKLGKDRNPFGGDLRGKSNWTLISGCRPSEVSIEDSITLEGKRYRCGLLTRALFEAILKECPCSYEKLHRRIYGIVTDRNPDQHPQLEGNYEDHSFLSHRGNGSGGDTVPVDRFCGSVTRVQGDRVWVDVGGSSGVTRGSVLGVYPRGARSPRSSGKIGDLEVVGPGMVTSQTRILGGSGRIEPGCPVWELSRSYVKEKLMVFVDNFPDSDQIKSRLRGMSFVKPVGPSEYADRIIRKAATGSGIEICNMSGYVINRFSSPSAISNIENALKSAYMIKRLSAFANPNPGFRINVSIGNRYEFKPGDTAKFTVTSTADCHLILLNIGSDGSVTLLYPNKYHRNNRIRKGETIEIPPPNTFRYRINPPGGQEMIKAIATREYIDPWGIDVGNLSTTFKSLQGEPDEIVDNLILTFNKKLGGSKPISVERVSVPGTGNWTTDELLYIIKE